MAVRDRFIIKLRDPAQPDIEIVATKQGGSVAYDPPGRNSEFYSFEEMNSVAKTLRRIEVHKDSVMAIIEEPSPKAAK
jgi:hypothetical protein